MFILQCSDAKKSCSCPLKAVLIINLSKLRFVVKKNNNNNNNNTFLAPKLIIGGCAVSWQHNC